MKASLKSEIEELIKKERLNCTVEEFAKKANWDEISSEYKLTEEFIREFATKVYWNRISIHQKLSEEFRTKFKLKK